MNQTVMFSRAVILASMLVMPVAAWASARSDAKEQVEFGIKVAQTGLWREAQYRWERAVELDPTYAEAWNNLAVVYMREGRRSDAEAAVKNAERSGFRVNPNLKADIKKVLGS